ncbi:hypothetical protein [Oceanimonas baumannii]|uniref:Uncharacterized protein n=1 Tax=Oceanimonas baumannii TaxID=129578 RepID=A0A235CLH8_9GAMM|nr:hypothetical protein [Oceanimonas baumannii]OYD25423.1 hypothetical protein B6S09_04175 [Oceanimonas baumannii]TDW61382.1 hypothetical protein LY04_00920 [Oceanimonas baumannii]
MTNEINVAFEVFSQAKQNQDEIDQQIVSLEQLKSKLIQEKAEKEQRLEAQSSVESDGLIYGDSKTLKSIAQLKGAVLVLGDRIKAIDTKIGKIKGQLSDAYLATQEAREKFNSLYISWLESEALNAIKSGLSEALKPAAGFIKVRKKIIGHNVFDSIERSFVQSGMEKLIIETLSELSSSEHTSEVVLLPGAEEVVFKRYQPASLSHEELKLLSTPAGRHKLKVITRTQ